MTIRDGYFWWIDAEDPDHPEIVEITTVTDALGACAGLQPKADRIVWSHGREEGIPLSLCLLHGRFVGPLEYGATAETIKHPTIPIIVSMIVALQKTIPPGTDQHETLGMALEALNLVASM